MHEWHSQSGMKKQPQITATLHRKISEIAPDAWDVCAGGDNPFISHAFLSALEDSNSASPHTGWVPCHAALCDEDEKLLAVAPLYLKSHSYGEYVFDQGWAEAFEQAGGEYYPKLQSAVPFSPIPGKRLLIHPDVKLDIAEFGLALQTICANMKLSSAHITFCDESEWKVLGENGWLQRLGVQYHWHNEGYKNFDNFLGTLSSRKRKTIKQERRKANENLIIKTLTGSEIKTKHWNAFYQFYHSTVDRKWGHAYLSREFFTLLSERLGDKVILMLAEYDDNPIAGALNLAGSNTLYGRNWGSRGEWPFLHFELCYYRAIEYAIEHGLKRVEAGAQGEHKIQRGYLPQPTYSVHWIAHQGFAKAVADFLKRERVGVENDIKALGAFSPYKKD
jgi:predicted N-acyltransferase